MDPQFQELAAQITRDVTEAVKRDVTEALKDHVTEVVSAAERRLTEHAQGILEGTERRLSEQARINVEAVKDQAKLAAEGYAGVVESIDARLTRIEDRLDDQATLYDKVLKNHHDRITVLEHRPS